MSLVAKLSKSFRVDVGIFRGLQLDSKDKVDEVVKEKLVALFKDNKTVKFVNSTLTPEFLKMLADAAKTAREESMFSGVSFVDCEHVSGLSYLVLEESLMPLLLVAKVNLSWELNPANSSKSKKQQFVFAEGKTLVIDFDMVVDFLLTPFFEKIASKSLVFKEVNINVVSANSATLNTIFGTLKGDQKLHLLVQGYDIHTRYPKDIKPAGLIFKKLIIANITIESNAVDAVIGFINNAKGVKSLSLKNVRFRTEEDLNKVLKAIAGNHTIEKLMLENIQAVKLRDQTFLVGNQSLKSLIIKKCLVSNSYQKNLVRVLHRHNLTLTVFFIDAPLLPELRLMLNSNRHPHTFAFVDRMIFLTRVIKILYELQKHSPSDFVRPEEKNGADIRTQWMQRFASVYDYVTLSAVFREFIREYAGTHIKVVSYPAMQKYVNVFRKMVDENSFEEIKLEGVVLGESEVAGLARIISGTKNLKTLKLIHVTFRCSAGLDQLFVAIAKNPTIETVVLRNIYNAKLTTTDFIIFNTMLKRLVIQKCFVAEDYQEKLASRLIKFNFTLVELEMDVALIPELRALLNYNRSPGKFFADERMLFFMKLIGIFRTLEKVPLNVLEPNCGTRDAKAGYEAWMARFTNVNCYDGSAKSLSSVLSDFMCFNGQKLGMKECLIKFGEQLAVIKAAEQSAENRLPAPEKSTQDLREAGAATNKTAEERARSQWETGAKNLTPVTLNAVENLRQQLLQQNNFFPVTSMSTALLVSSVDTSAIDTKAMQWQLENPPPEVPEFDPDSFDPPLFQNR